MTVETLAQTRLICADVLHQELTPDDGSLGLETSHERLAQIAGAEVGLWDASPGFMDEVEADEVFLILAGTGTLSFEDHSSIELRPGVLVRLRAGDRTRWTIGSRIRQLYLS